MVRCTWIFLRFAIAMSVCLHSGCGFTGGGRTWYGSRPQDCARELNPQTLSTIEEQTAPPPEAIQITPAPLPEPPQPPPTETVVESLPPAAPPSQPPPPSDPPAIAALRAYLNRDTKLLKKLSKTDREVLDALLPVVARAGENGFDHAGPKDVDLVLRQLDLLAEMLRPRASLTLGKVLFTQAIDGFGVYEPRRPSSVEGIPVFRAGVDGRPGERIQVYAEVRNATVRKVGAFHETVLASQVEIIDSTGHMVFPLNRPARPDCSFSPRQDYFLNIQFPVPAKLPAGYYTLQIVVRDEAAPTSEPRTVRQRLDFRVESAR
jgi:hypothetical protein